MTLTFVQLSAFVADWRRNRLTDADLRELESILLSQPQAGAVIGGTGGLRKLRFAPPSRHTGKSGAFRVIYAYFPRYSHLYLFLLYGKNEQGNLDADEKRQCHRVVVEIAKLLNERFGSQ